MSATQNDVIMIEGAAKEMPEGGFHQGPWNLQHPFVQQIIAAQIELAQKAGKPKPPALRIIAW